MVGEIAMAEGTGSLVGVDAHDARKTVNSSDETKMILMDFPLKAPTQGFALYPCGAQACV
jgi:hypothetical protein